MSWTHQNPAPSRSAIMPLLALIVMAAASQCSREPPPPAIVAPTAIKLPDSYRELPPAEAEALMRDQPDLVIEAIRQVVTGLVVNDKPNLPRRLRRKLRAAVDQRVRTGQATWHGKPVSDAKLLGLLAHLNLVQPEEARRHRQRLAVVLKGKASA